MQHRKHKIWYAWLGAAALLSAISFTPLVIPAGEIHPIVLGMPRTLWAGILITAALVLLTYMAGRYAPRDADQEGPGE